MPPNPNEIDRLEQQALTALQQGRRADAHATWLRILALDPGHVRALTQSGQHAFMRSDFAAARQAFERAAAAEPSDPRHWVNVAFACERLGDDAAVERALFEALSADPSDITALLLRGRLHERHGRTHQAASAYGAAVTVAGPVERLPPEMRPSLAQAMEYAERHRRSFAEFVDRFLEPHFAGLDGDALERFRLSVDILVGRKRRYESRPMRYFVPRLEPVEFFARADFPFLDVLEAATDDIRAEFMDVLASERDIEPYIAYERDQPIAQWAPLNHSPAWSAFHLVKDGAPVAAHAARCPKTMAAWSAVPAPEQPGRTPVAMFSLLKPRTHIPAHVGASNARLVCHLPLIVPPGCRFRVGNAVREWTPGRAWVFDDTIEHEAWNDSDALRVVLIFDTWHPRLSADERRLITGLNAALNAFNADSGKDYDV
jgi:aspartate beta-hydroxylase